MDNRQRLEAERTLDRMLDAYNRHDIDAVIACYTRDGELRDEAWAETHGGTDALRAHYARDFQASPDITLRTVARYQGEDSLVARLVVTGTHDGEWRGLPGTGATFDFVCFTTCRFTPAGDAIAALEIAYDRARIFQQLGVMHDLDTTLGKALTALTHPLTMAKAARRRVSNRPPPPHH